MPPNLYLITARIMPERLHRDLEVITPHFTITKCEGAPVTCQVTVAGGQIVMVASTQVGISDLGTFIHDVTNSIRTVTDTASFMLAAPIDVDIVSVFHFGTYRYYVIDPFVPEFGPIKETTLTPEDVLPIAMESTILRMALADYRHALAVPLDTGVFCFRAVETIATGFLNTTENDRKVAWTRMRQSLNIERSWIQPITDASIPRRHGALIPITSEARRNLLERTWWVISRYVEYLMGGKSLAANTPTLSSDDG